MDDDERNSRAGPAGADLVERVRQAWAEVLDAETVAPDVDFLEAGGSSLLLVMLWEELRELTERDLRVADLFQHRTVLAQAALLATPPDPREPALAATGLP